jgi:hypothetical protein
MAHASREDVLCSSAQDPQRNFGNLECKLWLTPHVASTCSARQRRILSASCGMHGFNQY